MQLVKHQVKKVQPAVTNLPEPKIPERNNYHQPKQLVVSHQNPVQSPCQSDVKDNEMRCQPADAELQERPKCTKSSTQAPVPL